MGLMDPTMVTIDRNQRLKMRVCNEVAEGSNNDGCRGVRVRRVMRLWWCCCLKFEVADVGVEMLLATEQATSCQAALDA